ncbi:AMP-dependent synthetase/ligase [Streptomyces sp. NRRL S-920]|uniref:AMP-dependent synthetase/ligase n=1 Tax=Streptomyces sp. NRRL S-920 TaxID=1463921 RepID=UPI00131CB274|nr:AMP-binding protein [Streptomyces sp. NRRL S-920]
MTSTDRASTDMTGTDMTASHTCTDGRQTLAGLARRGAERLPTAPAVRWRDSEGAWRTRSYADARRESEEIARGLMALGLRPGDRVAIQSALRPEWTFTLLGAAASGLVLVSLLPTTVPEEITHVMNDSGATVLICEDADQWAKVKAARSRLPALRHIVLIDAPEGADGIMTLAELRALGREQIPSAALRRRQDAVRPDDLLVIIYTSGTTGPKKGCALSHGNYVSVLRAHPAPPPKPADAPPDLSNGTLYVVTGPHTIALLMQLLTWWSGYTLAYFSGGPPERMLREIRETAPKLLPLVPLVLERIYSAVLGSRPEGERHRLVEQARLGLQVRERHARGESLPAELSRWFEEADAGVFAEVRAHFGGRVRRVTVSGAAVSQDLLAFFLGCGVPVVECYGMTETAAAVTSNSPDDYRLGTVGRPLPGVEVDIAPDGEVLVRGGNVFRGYWGYDEGRFGAVHDGWLHTGDLGEIDEDGRLRLLGRKKEVIQLSHGMAVTPHPLERQLRASPLISHAVLYGESRPHLVALLTLDERHASAWAAERGLPTDLGALVRRPELLRELDGVVARANSRLQEYYRAKAFTVLDRDLSVDTGELTISLKVARPVVYALHRERFEALYD